MINPKSCSVGFRQMKYCLKLKGAMRISRVISDPTACNKSITDSDSVLHNFYHRALDFTSVLTGQHNISVTIYYCIPLFFNKLRKVSDGKSIFLLTKFSFNFTSKTDFQRLFL